MRKYLQYLVGSQKTQYIREHNPQLLKKKYVAESLKEQTEKNVRGVNNLKLQDSDEAPTLLLDLEASSVVVLKHSEATDTTEGNSATSTSSNNANSSPADDNNNNAKRNGGISAQYITQYSEEQLYKSVESFLSKDNADNKKVFYISLPSEWYEYKKMLTPSTAKSKDPILASEASKADSSSPSTVSADSLKFHIEKLTTINLDAELFRKPCFACLMPHSSVLYLVTSLGIEAISVPQVESYLAEKQATSFGSQNTSQLSPSSDSHLWGDQDVLNQSPTSAVSSPRSARVDSPLFGGALSGIQASSSKSNDDPLQQDTSTKKVQKQVWLTMHTSLCNDLSMPRVQPVTLHICAILIQDRNVIACGDTDGHIRFYSLTSKGSLQFQLPPTPNHNSQSANGSENGVPIMPPVENSLFYQPHAGPVTDLCYLPQKDQIVSSGIDGTCRLWSLKHRRLVRILVPPAASIALTRRLVSASNAADSSTRDNHSSLFSTHKLSQTELLTPPSPRETSQPTSSSESSTPKTSLSHVNISPVTKIDVDTHANVLTVGHLNGEIRQYNLFTGEKILALGNRTEKQSIKSLAILSRSQFLVFANERQLVRVWDILQEKENSRFTSNTSRCMLYSDRRDVLFTCTETGDVQLHKGFVIEILKKERKLQEINTLKLHTSPIRSIWYHSDCDLLVTVANNGQIAVHMDVVDDSIDQLDDKLKSQLMDHFYNYNIQVSNLTEEQKTAMIRELTSSLSKYPEEQQEEKETTSTSAQDASGEESSASEKKSGKKSESTPPATVAFHRTFKQQQTFELVLNGLKKQSQLQPRDERLKKALVLIQKERDYLDDQLRREHVSSRKFLKHNHQILRTKYIDYIHSKKVAKTKKQLLSKYEAEKEAMKKRHQQELEALKKKYKQEKDEFLQKKSEETTNAAKTYMSVKQTYMERINNLDIESAELLHRLITRLNICATHHFRGIDSSQYKILSKMTDEAKHTYIAVDFENQRLVAIRAFPPGIHLSDELQHERLVPVHEILCTDSHTFVIMDYMTSNLRNHLRWESSFLKKKTIQRILYDILLALEYLHQQGMVHREIRPSNILLDDETHAYLAHFGIMKSVRVGMFLTNGSSDDSETESGSSNSENCQEEQEDHVTFSAPELYANSITFASDVWSAGIVFGYLLQTERERQEKPLVNGEDPLSILHSMIQLSEPSKEEIEKVGNGTEIFQQLRPTNKYDQIQQKISCASEEEVDLLKKMLVFDPDARGKIEELKRHRYFSDRVK